MGVVVTTGEIVLLVICGSITAVLAFFKVLEVWKKKQSKVHAMSRQQMLEAMSAGDCGRGHKLYLCDQYTASETEDSGKEGLFGRLEIPAPLRKHP